MKKHVALAACFVAVGTGAAFAQNAATYDAAQLPATRGRVAAYSLTPRGDVDGLILADGTEVHVPPHLGTQLVFVVKPGDPVTIRGLHALAIPMVQAMSVSNDATGKAVLDIGPGGPPGPRGFEQKLSALGRIKVLLHGPQGELNGVLLDEGTIVRMPPPEAQRLADQLSVGAPLAVQGSGYQGDLGRVIEAAALGPNNAQLTQIAPLPSTGGPGAPPLPPPPPGGPGMVPPPPPRG